MNKIYPRPHEKQTVYLKDVITGAKFLFTSGNHSMKSLATYTFPFFFDE